MARLAPKLFGAKSNIYLGLSIKSFSSERPDHIVATGVEGVAKLLGTGTHTDLSVNPRYFYGARGFYHPKICEGLRLGITATRSRVLLGLQVPALLGPPVEYSMVDGDVISDKLLLSAEWTHNDWTFAAEYSVEPQKWTIGVDFPVAFPMADISVLDKTIGETYYVMGEYRLNKCWKIGSYYSVLYLDRSNRSDHESHTKDIALTLRHDVNEYFAIKLEGHNMHGAGLLNSLSADTGGFTSGLLGGSSVMHSNPNWWLFAVKATFSF